MKAGWFCRRVRGCAIALLLLVVCLARPAAAETRVALVIGISAYQNAPPLTNPVNDARAIGDALRRLNFEVEELYDPDFRALTRGVREFGIRAQRADTAVVYYAGHGVQVDRENYLLPADAKLERERDLLYEAMPLSLMLGEVSQANKIGIVLLDACRNNPFIERITRSFSTAGRAIATTSGLARVDGVPRNTLVAMATKADQVADDGSGGNSPFAAALLAHLQIPGLELSLFFRSVRDAVLKATNNRQEPYVFSSLGAEPFYFYSRPPNRPPVIGAIAALEVLDSAGPTPLGIPRPTDPDQDPLTVRIIGLPHSGEVRVDARRAGSGEAFALDRFMTGTFKPDGKMLGPIGTLDILVEDGRGGSVTGSLPIVVLPSNHPPVVEVPRTVRAYPTALAIVPPIDPDGDALTVTIKAVPRGTVRNGTAAVRVGERLRPQDVANLSFMPEAGVVGEAGSLRYLVEDGRGGAVEGRVDLEVVDAPEATRPRREEVASAQPAPPSVVPSPRPSAGPPRPPSREAAAMPAAPPPLAAPVPAKAAAPEPRQQIAMAQPPMPPREIGAADRVVPAVPSLPRAGTADAGAFQDCPTCPLMSRIPEGAFVMGQGAKEPEAMPPHRVSIRAFALSQFPVTVAEWKVCVDDSGCRSMPRMAAAEDRTPVHNLSWDDAQQYVGWLARRTGRHYRLPSEAEWEYAARAGTTTRYWWGNEVGVALANCADCGGRQDLHAPLPVGSFRPNAFGLYDMLGGVAQWTADCWFPTYRDAPGDGSARGARTCLQRVLRGGSFRAGRDEITLVSRGNYDSSVRYIVNGLRVARDLD